MNYIEMTHTCEACGRNDCDTACKDGVCKINQQEEQHAKENQTE